MEEQINCNGCGYYFNPFFLRRRKDNKHYCGGCEPTNKFEQEHQTNQELIKELAKRLRSGQISFAYDMYGRETGLYCKDYEFSFPGK